MGKDSTFRKFLKSMKFRLILLFSVIGILPCLIFCVGLLRAYEDRALNLHSIDITSQAKILATQIAANNYIDHPEMESITAQLTQLSNIYDGRVMLIDRAFQIVADTYALDEQKTIISEEVIRSFSGKEISKYDKKSRYLEMTIPITETGNKKVTGVMLVSVSMDGVMNNKDLVARHATVLALLLSVFILGFAVFVSGRLVRPLRKMEKSIRDIQTGYGDGELQIDQFTETREMSESFNQLLTRMRVLDDSRQEFVSNVSHELKTPLTSMKVLADSLNSMEDAPVELYKEFMEDITNEIERENKIITDLLSLVKMDKSAADLNITTVNINEMLELILKRLRPIAEKQNIELVLETFRPVTAEIDEVKLTLAVTNLVENGIKYNQESGWVHVTLNADHQYFYVKVEDSGIGIPEEALEHIYERFYRVDKSHSREIGGTGLGLAITRNAVLMHRGAIKAYSTEGEGTIFTIRIPLNYIV
ncbi:MAG: two-component sensor histidine kinase [Lachnospiraceae bacterium]|nr:two-component sensor histidine kinase [Lachnospiraceae bacterium]